MNGMLDAAAELAVLLEQENDALRRSDFSATEKLAYLKCRAIERVSAGLCGLADRPSSAGAGIPHEVVRARLEKALAENKRLLEAAVKVQAEVIAVVLRAIEVPVAPRYRLDGTHSAASVPPVALAMRA